MGNRFVELADDTTERRGLLRRFQDRAIRRLR
jgi:hypothetical protein